MRRIPVREGAYCKHLFNRTPGVFLPSVRQDNITVIPYDAVRLEDRAGGGYGGLLPRPHQQARMRAGGDLRRRGSGRA